MNEPHVAPAQGGGPRYSPDGRWQWDGQRWTPVTDAGHSAIIQPPRDAAPAPQVTAQPAPTWLGPLVLVLGIGSIVLAAAVWIFSFNFRIDRVDDVILAVLLVLGFVAGELAVVFGLAPARRPRGPGQIAAFTCGLIGVGVLLFFVASTLLIL